VELAVVNMIPLSFSGETNQDSEPNVAVDPADPATIAASAFTPDPDPNATHAPIFISKDGGATWSLNSIVPYCPGITRDITLRFSSNSHHLYVAYLTNALGKEIAVVRTSDMTFATDMELISTVQSGDQPYVQAATVLKGPDAGKDRVYVGYYDGWAQLHYSLDAAASTPVFKTVRLEARDVAYDLPQVRTAIHPDGTVYVAFQSYYVGDLVDVVVVRDNDWGSGVQPFTALKDSGDSKSGQRVVQGVSIDNVDFGQEVEKASFQSRSIPGMLQSFTSRGQTSSRPPGTRCTFGARTIMGRAGPNRANSGRFRWRRIPRWRSTARASSVFCTSSSPTFKINPAGKRTSAT
jgi:hypothetical protein